MPFIFGNHQCPFSTFRFMSITVGELSRAAKPREIFVQIKEEQRSDLIRSRLRDDAELDEKIRGVGHHSQCRVK